MQGAGRPKSEGELAQKRKDVYFKPSEWKRLNKKLDGTSVKIGTFIHDAAIRALNEGLSELGNGSAPDRSYIAKFLTKAPCGPWSEALEHAGEFLLSEQIADELEVRDGDVIVRAMGESMDGMGIMDGALLIMRPLPDNKLPLRGEVALVQILTADGEYLGTIKQWQPGNPPALKDGDGHEFGLPEDVKEIRPVAVARGIIGRL